MPTTFHRERKTITVSPANPLPVTLTQTDSVPTEPTNIETLLYSLVTPTVASSSSPTHKDLLDTTDGEMPTIAHALPYRRFILTGFHPQPSGSPTSMTLNVALWARATDPSGAPLHTSGVNVWYKVGDFTASTNTAAGGSYFRTVLESPDGKPLGFDAYRITVNVSFSGGTSPSLGLTSFVLRGER
jgi:hypothetical protein